MDLLTQSLLGATVAQSGARTAELRRATIIGACSGLLADADALIRSSQDSLLFLEFHRHFTHSLVFIPLGALIAAMILFPFYRKTLPVNRLYLYCLLGYMLSGVLDSLTSYGTHLFWPFSEQRVAMGIIAIVDPIFTLTLMVAMIVAVRRKATRPARLGLALASCYLIFGTLQHYSAEATMEEWASYRGHPVTRLLVKPTIGNLLLWRSIYESNGVYYVDAVRVSPFGKPVRYEGGKLAKLDLRREFPQLSDGHLLYRDIERFRFFSDNFVARHPEKDNVIGDVRYSFLPNGTVPLWGIEFDPQRPEQHAKFGVWRDTSDSVTRRFWAMLRGRTLQGKI